MNTLTKNDLIQLVMSNSELSRNEAYGLVENFFDTITHALGSGEDVKISGFGNFVLRDKKARIGRNPKTKEEFPINARRVVSFHTSNILKAKINSSNRNNEQD